MCKDCGDIDAADVTWPEITGDEEMIGGILFDEEGNRVAYWGDLEGFGIEFVDDCGVTKRLEIAKFVISVLIWGGLAWILITAIL